VIDEVVGLLVTMTFVEPSLTAVIGGFLIFRLLDITKPLGISLLERSPGGVGVMLDDFAAGVLGNLALRVLLELRTLG